MGEQANRREAVVARLQSRLARIEKLASDREGTRIALRPAADRTSSLGPTAPLRRESLPDQPA